MLHTELVRRPGNHLAKAGHSATGLVLEMVGVQGKPNHSTIVRHRPDHVVFFVAQSWAPCVRVCMGYCDWTF